jgi:hypothetical protein
MIRRLLSALAGVSLSDSRPVRGLGVRIGGPRYRSWRTSLLICVLGTILAGCQVAPPRGVAMTQPAVPTEGSASLAEYVADQPYVTVEPAYRATYALWKGEAFSGDFAALSAALRDGRIIGSGWKYAADALIDRDSVGHLFCRACDIRTGLNWQLSGLGRYAWRELQYRGIAGPGSEYGYISGGQFVGMLSRAEQYVARQGHGAAARLELEAPQK